MSGELPMMASLNRDARRILFKETLIGVLVNALVIPAIIWLVNVKPPPALGGPDGVLSSLAKATTVAAFLMTLVGTLVLRMRAAKGTLPIAWPAVSSWSRFLPRNVVARALLFALAAMVTLLPLGVAVCICFDLYPMSKQDFALVNVCYGTLIGTVVTPFITLAAMADQSVRRN